MTPRPHTLAIACALVGGLTVAAVGCAGSAKVSSGNGVTVTTIALTAPTAAPVLTAPPTVPPPATPAPAPETAAPDTTAPSTVAPAEPETTPAPTVPPTEPPTTVPETTTLPPEYALLEPAPPSAALITAIGTEPGDGTRAVQQRLLDLGFWLSGVDGDYGLTTRQAVMAFQKYNLLAVTGKVDEATASALTYAPYKPRGQSTTGNIIEINKTMQLLFIIRDGRTIWVLNASTGNGQPYEEADRNTPGEVQRGISITKSGLFQVNRERPEGWWEGDLGKIYRPKYFNGGIAVHGSGSVPNYPASHGCVRVSVPAMDFIWAENLMPLETPVWVYGDDIPPQG